MPTDDLSKGSFILYHSHWAALKKLSNEKLGRLIRAIFEREVNGIPVDLSDDEVLEMAYSFMSNQLDMNRAKWERTRDARSEAGKRSGEMRRKKKKQNEQVFDLTKRSEQTEQAPRVLNKDEEAEQMSDLLNKHEPNVDDNVDEKENVDVNVDGDVDGDVDGETCNCASSSITTINSSLDYDFWIFYEVFFFRGFKHAIRVTQGFVAYYEDSNWTLSGGKVLNSIIEKIQKARIWTPKDQKLQELRPNPEFIDFWAAVWLTLKQQGAPDHLVKAALDERIGVEYKMETKSMTITLPKSVAEYIDTRPEVLAPLVSLRKEKGYTQIIYNPINDPAFEKYRLLR